MPRELKADLVCDNTIAVIHKFMIFNCLDTSDLKKMLAMNTAVIRKYSKGEAVISEGDFGSCSFWVIKGIFDVIQDGIHIATLSNPGEVFGEMSIFEKIPRVATVKSVTDGICLCLDMEVVDQLEDQRIKTLVREEFAAIMLARLEETRQWLEQERQRIDDKYADLLESKKQLQDRLIKKD